MNKSILIYLQNLKINNYIKLLEQISKYYQFDLSYLLKTYITKKIHINSYIISNNKINYDTSDLYYIDSNNKVFQKKNDMYELIGIKCQNNIYISI